MTYHPDVAANAFINQALKDQAPLNHITLQTLLYIAHGVSLATLDQPLHHGAWEAWAYGPVLPQIYFSVQHYLGQPIAQPIPNAPPADGKPQENEIIAKVYQLRSLQASQLLEITRGDPWRQIRSQKSGSLTIPNTAIQEYFQERDSDGLSPARSSMRPAPPKANQENNGIIEKRSNAAEAWQQLLQHMDLCRKPWLTDPARKAKYARQVAAAAETYIAAYEYERNCRRRRTAPAV